MTVPVGSVAPPKTFGELLGALPDWARRHLLRTIIAAVAAGVIGYVANVWMMAVRYQGTADVPEGAPATASGNVIGGGLFWALGSSVVFGIVGYRQAAGKERFWREARGLPRTLAGLVRREGAAGQAHLLWGASAMLLAGLFLPPALGAMTAVAVLVATPTVLGSIITSSLFRLWQAAVKPLGPSAPRPTGIESMVVGVIGGGLALTAGMLISDRTIRGVLAAAAAAAAILISKQVRPPAAAVVLLVFVAAAVAVDVLFAATATADDGGLLECNGSWNEWLKECSGSAAVRRDSIAGGIASAIGAPLGGFVGGVVGSFPLTDPGSGEPLIFFDPTIHGGGQPGQVWWGGKWMDPNSAEFRTSYEQNVETVEELRAGHQMMEEFHERNRQYEEDRRQRILAEQDAARAERARQQQARETLNKIQDAAIARSGQERYEEVLNRLNANAFRPDGSVDVEYVNRMRNAVGRMLRTDQTISDEDLRPTNWVTEGMRETGATVFHVTTTVARVGAAYYTLGASEIAWQGVGAAKQIYGEPSVVEGVKNAAWYVAEENLPITTAGKLYRGEEVGVMDVVGDTLKATQVYRTGSTFVRGQSAGLRPRETWTADAVAAETGLSVEVRATSSARLPGGVPKPPTIHTSAVTKAEEALYGSGTAGRVPAGPPPPPPAGASADVVAAYERRVAQSQRWGHDLPDGYANQGGFVTREGTHVTSDVDLYAFRNADGSTLSAAQAAEVTAELQRRGLPVTHPDVASWVTKTPAEAALKEQLLQGGPAAVFNPQTVLTGRGHVGSAITDHGGTPPAPEPTAEAPTTWADQQALLRAELEGQQ